MLKWLEKYIKLILEIEMFELIQTFEQIILTIGIIMQKNDLSENVY